MHRLWIALIVLFLLTLLGVSIYQKMECEESGGRYFRGLCL